MDKMPQELEFKAWGISKIAVRNIVVFFIVCLISAIGFLSKVIVVQNDELNRVYRERLQDKDAEALKIEQLKNESLETLIKLNDIIVKQENIRNQIRDARSSLKRIKQR